ncbi:hypothetical protein [Serratia proteamaculans]|uniref:hypothetical protein n=1 Tax=Serratia proteamaculans TaxID=28151 RepID=UPI0020C69DA0|nr:hypothetical protein [Serratia proteamaculans]
MIEKRLLGELSGRVIAATVLQNIEHSVLNDIGLTIPTETGILPELKNRPTTRMQVARELAEKRQRFQQKGAKS